MPYEPIMYVIYRDGLHMLSDPFIARPGIHVDRTAKRTRYADSELKPCITQFESFLDDAGKGDGSTGDEQPLVDDVRVPEITPEDDDGTSHTGIGDEQIAPFPDDRPGNLGIFERLDGKGDIGDRGTFYEEVRRAAYAIGTVT